MIDTARGTGRTYRMVQTANAAYVNGEQVLVIVHNRDFGQRLHTDEYGLSPSIPVWSHSAQSLHRYFRDGFVEGFEGRVFVDHLVFELRIAELEKQLNILRQLQASQ